MNDDSVGCLLVKIAAFLCWAAIVIGMMWGLLMSLDNLYGAVEQEAVRQWAWLEWIAWRGVAVGLAALAILWFRILAVFLWRRVVVGRRLKYSASLPIITQPPSSLPAAAIPVLERREATSQALLAALVEMCQNGDLKIIGVREAYDGNEGSKRKGKYTYRLTQLRGPPKGWERTICAAIPHYNIMVSELSHLLGSQSPLIGAQLGDLLQRRGLFSGNPTSTLKLFWTSLLEWLGISLMGIGLAVAFVAIDGAWWAKAHLLFVAGSIYLVAWWGARKVNRRQSKTPPTDAGTEEIGRWMRLKQYLKSLTRVEASSRTDRLLPYAVALNAADPWLKDELDAPPWFDVASAESARGLDLSRREAYHGFMSAKAWDLSGRSESASGWAVFPVGGSGGDGGDGDGGDGGFDFDF